MLYDFPLRPSTLSERATFYKNEFSLLKLKKWLGNNVPQLCAIDAGSDTKIIKNKRFKGINFYFPFSELKDKIKKYVPEDVYYDRNIYIDAEKRLSHLSDITDLSDPNILGQQLAFDIDADNIPCSHPRNQDVCHICLGKAYDAATKMKKELKKKFERVILVYSGRGFHLHINDKSAYYLTPKQRHLLNKKFSKFPIDPWVSGGPKCLIRLPFSLNSLVSRVVTPISNKTKFTEKTGIPKFLKDNE